MENIVGRQIRRCNRNLLMFNVVVLLVLLLWGRLEERYFYNFFAGPFPETPAGLLKIGDANEVRRYFVSLDDVHPAKNAVAVEKDSAGNVEASYFAILVGKKLMVIRTRSAAPATRYEGALQPITKELHSTLQKQLDAIHRQFEDVVQPFVLDTIPFRMPGYFELALAVPLGILGFYNIGKALLRMSGVRGSPIYRALQKHFSQPPEVTAQMIDDDMRTAGGGAALRGTAYGSFNLLSDRMRLGSSWLLHQTYFSFTPMQLNEIVWVYQMVISHSMYGARIGKTSAAAIADKWGRRVVINPGHGKDAKVVDFVREVTIRAPWAIAGFSREVQQKYHKDRGALVAAVDARRVEYQRVRA